MQWQSYLRTRTRQPEFVWRVALAILAVGAVVAYVVQASAVPAIELLGDQNQELSDYVDRLDQLAAAGRWVELWWALPHSMWLGARPGPTVLAVITGICWLVFILQVGQPYRPSGIRWYLAVIGVGLGVISIWPTLFAIYWQEQVWDLHETNDLAGGLKYFLLGVGLREELAKLLLFLPLVPWIIRRGSEREALLLAACVGLGFAMEENVVYFSGDAGRASGRFLMANFLHMSLTGLAGLALCRGIWHPRERGAESAAILLLVVIVHGMYDALIVLPDLEGIAIANSILFILLAYQFFHELRAWWQPPGETISLTATFLVAVSVVTASSLIYLSSLVGFNTALQAALIPTVSLGIMVYLFLREMPESVIDV